MKMTSSLKAVFLLLALASLSSSCCLATDVSYDGRALKIDGKRRILISGSIHYPRSTPEMWPDLINKSKEGGLDAIETYVFWDGHEPGRRKYNFEGNYDLIKFVKTVQQAGLYVILRIGPYVCAEWNYGGFPVWLHQIPGVELRTDDQMYKDEMQNFTSLIVSMVKQEKLLAPQGGPIILTQIENEYGNIMGPYGEAGKRYIQWCAKMAESLDAGVPWIMCQQNDAPQPMINTCNGFYCDWFKPNNPNSPKMWTENWTGWFKKWGQKTPTRPAEDVAFAVARFFQEGGTLQNYYMYHGGTNFGRTAGGPYVTTSYDYDAPLDEYGNLRQPKWGHLKELHSALKSMEKVLTDGEVKTTNFSSTTKGTMYTVNGTSGCFLSNTNTTTDAKISFQGNNFFLPAWSVSILPDCKQEVYNTAKVNAQTSVMTMVANKAEDEQATLSWQWTGEKIEDALEGEGFPPTDLKNQLDITGDTSDYLWYMTSVKIATDDPIWRNQVILRVNTSGHTLRAFVNGKHVGSQHGYSFLFETPVTLKKANQITLLSATVGLPNYGAFFDLAPSGIIGGPVQLIGEGNITIDLSKKQWTRKIGLNGEMQQLYSDASRRGHVKWSAGDLRINRLMTWYKTTFKAPPGGDAVVVDLQGMGKGQAWINGQSIGRYWANFTAPSDGCGWCDYRGKYDSDQKCRTSCGQPSQRWYHVPRSFLRPDNNTLVLFEEAGGNPSQINFQTVAVGTVCAHVEQGRTFELSCQGSRPISEIKFASYGDPQGTCGSFKKGTFESSKALSVVEKACVGKESCSINVGDDVLGSSQGGGVKKKLAVEAAC